MKTSLPLLSFFQVYQVLNPSWGCLYYSKFFLCNSKKVWRKDDLQITLDSQLCNHAQVETTFHLQGTFFKSIFKIINFPWILASSFQVSIWPNLYNKSNRQVISRKKHLAHSWHLKRLNTLHMLFMFTKQDI